MSFPPIELDLPMPYDIELQAALAASRAASAVILDAYTDFQAIPDARADISTEADRQAQEAILQLLRRQFPSDAFCAEERTPTLAECATSGERLWVIDPIDGTRGFAKKNGEFSVMVAFVKGGEIGVGVVLEPAARRVTYAVKGEGCWRQDGDAAEPTRCQVSAIDTLAEATLTQSRSKRPSRPSAALRPARIIETYSAGIKLALVARGEADVYVNTYDAFHDWDICAGHILVAEAGGRVTGLRGQTLRYGLPGAWQRQGLLASNGVLHESALEHLARAQVG
jgi:3'(2'), 5'-bisphosphate nucleotidase